MSQGQGQRQKQAASDAHHLRVGGYIVSTILTVLAVAFGIVVVHLNPIVLTMILILSGGSGVVLDMPKGKGCLAALALFVVVIMLGLYTQTNLLAVTILYVFGALVGLSMSIVVDALPTGTQQDTGGES